MIYVSENLKKYIHSFFWFLFGYLYSTNCFKTETLYYVWTKKRLSQLNQLLKTFINTEQVGINMLAYVMKSNEAPYLKKYSCDYNNSNAGGQRQHIPLNYIVKSLKMLNNITHSITKTYKIKYNFLERKIILNNRFFLYLFLFSLIQTLHDMSHGSLLHDNYLELSCMYFR